MTQVQLQATLDNPDMKKKLRVDRVRKMMMGQQTAPMQSNDNKQPEWKKYKTLQEIDMIRQTKKDMIIGQVMGNYLDKSKQVTVVPGEISFETLTVSNETAERCVYEVSVEDEDRNLFGIEEVTLVYIPNEIEQWVKKGKVKKPSSYDLITDTNTVCLPPGESVQLLFKFQTFRDVSHSTQVPASDNIIKQRSVRLVVSRNRQVVRQLECNVMPMFSPVDHVFRYFEPEQSYFKVRIPPFLQLTEEIHTKVSRQNA